MPPSTPLIITYRDDNENEKILILEANLTSGRKNNQDLLADKLNSLIGIT
jgi:hypothetical protein